MSFPRFVSILIALCLTGTAIAQSADAPPAPYLRLRDLQQLQAAIAHGDLRAYGEQPRLLASIAEELKRQPEAAWQDRRNIEAIAILSLSGSRSKIIADVANLPSLAAADKTLLQGVIALSEGRESEASSALLPINANTLSKDMAGHILLAQASLCLKNDPARAIVLLDQARLSMPDTLIEEAALRREIFLLEDGKAMDKFLLLARQYHQNYHDSVYAADYWPHFTRALSKLALKTDPAEFDHFTQSLEGFAAQDRVLLLLDVSRTALASGKGSITQLAAQEAAALSPPQSQEFAKARLYSASALIGAGHVQEGHKYLEQAEAVGLQREDLILAAATRRMSQALFAPINVVATTEPPQSKDGKALEASPHIDQAKKLLAEVDGLLKKGNP